MTLFIRRTGFITAPTPVQNPVQLNSVNGGVSPFNNQNTVNLVGNGFGTQQDTVTYNSIPLVVQTWADTLVQVSWPDIPFNPDYNGIDINAALTLSVIVGANSASQNVTTVVNPDSYYGVITSIPTGSIYGNDAGIELGVDKGYARVIAGTVDTINIATGIVSGASDGAQVEYAIYDVSDMVWAS